ncbi:tape measure protein [Chitinophaga nivalis]|uniref:Tape measure protein n=1 Tax=Chitinophaga nivalis TaxID=2991709 RepID=A0ABT3IFD0_9BACT|nr:tape measure protein [Chitinophaga nivalis]MCW3467639.1 tape measure protein [Chitinophaga nivalis]MCW3482669.1 tape measure protein [Chitinophaga nivalis]
MTDITTSDGFNQLSSAATTAMSRVSGWQRAMINNNTTLNTSFIRMQTIMLQLPENPPRPPEPAADTAPPKKKEYLPLPADSMIKGGASLIKMAMDLQQTQVAFERFTGSATSAKALVGSLQQMGTTTPFKSSDLIKNGQLLLENGMATQKLLPTLQLLGGVSGGNAEKMNTMSKAFGEVVSAGSLTQSTLGKMTDAGFNPLKEIARTTGLSMKQLEADMAAGKITADHLTNAMISATGPKGAFFGTMQAQSETAGARWQQFGETLQNTATSIGTALLPVATDFINNALIPMAQWLEVAATWLGEHSGVISILAGTIGGTLLAYKMWTIAQSTINLVMGLNPAWLVVAAIAALVTMVIYAWNHFAKFRAAIMGTWEWLQNMYKVIKDYVIDSVKEMLTGFSGLAKAFGYLFKGEWSKAFEAGQNAVNLLFSDRLDKRAQEGAKGAADAFHKEYESVLNAKSQPKLKIPGPPKPPVTIPPITGTGYAGLGNTKNNAPEGAKQQVAGITGGGGRDIIINLQKLFDTINITSNNVQQGVQDMEQMVTEALLRVLNSANALG